MLRSFMAWALCFFAAATAEAARFDINLFLHNRGTARGGGRNVNLLFDVSRDQYDLSTYLAPQPNEIFYSGFAEARLDAELTKWFSARLMLNSGEVREQAISLDGTTRLQRVWTINGRLVLDELRYTGFVRTAVIEFHAPDTQWWQIALGRKLWVLGNSLIYDDWGLGASLSLDFELLNGKPWRFDLSYIIPSRDWLDPPIRSPLITAKLEYKLSLFESLSLSLSYFHDGDDQLTETVRQSLVERTVNVDTGVRRPVVQRLLDEARNAAVFCFLNTEFKARGDLFYTTLSGNKTLGPGSLRGTVVVEAGRMLLNGVPDFAFDLEQRGDLGRPSLSTDCGQRARPIPFTSVGVAFELSYKWSITERLALTPYVLAQSGQPPPNGISNLYTAYIGVLPFITRTNLFFAGGLAETFGARRITSAGVNGRGVIAPGVEAKYEPVDPLRLSLSVTPLLSWAPGIEPPVGGGGRFYGVEIDSLIVYEPFSFLSIAAEGDVLFGGNFYGTPSPVWKAILSVNLTGDFTL